jgi:hypothetical protein
MAVERLGAIRVGSGDYARTIQQRATERGCIVKTHKTVRVRGHEYNQVIGYSSPTDSRIRRWWEGRGLGRDVDRELQQGETVIMTFARLKNERLA